jgi:hypothetical protein
MEVFSVGQKVFFDHEFNGEMSGNFRGIIDGKACLVVSGQNWFLDPSDLRSSEKKEKLSELILEEATVDGKISCFLTCFGCGNEISFDCDSSRTISIFNRSPESFDDFYYSGGKVKMKLGDNCVKCTKEHYHDN